MKTDMKNRRNYRLLVEFLNEEIDVLNEVAKEFNDNKTKAIKESLLLMKVSLEEEKRGEK